MLSFYSNIQFFTENLQFVNSNTLLVISNRRFVDRNIQSFILNNLCAIQTLYPSIQTGNSSIPTRDLPDQTRCSTLETSGRLIWQPCSPLQIFEILFQTFNNANMIFSTRQISSQASPLSQPPAVTNRNKPSVLSATDSRIKRCRSSAVDRQQKEHRPANFHSSHSANSQTRTSAIPENSWQINLFILSLRMYFSAICLIFCAIYIHSACCSLITEKLKLSQVSEDCPLTKGYFSIDVCKWDVIHIPY